MAEESAEKERLEVGDLAKTTITVKIEELQEECIEIRKNASGYYKCYNLSNVSTVHSWRAEYQLS